jgi:hypothetical protein
MKFTASRLFRLISIVGFSACLIGCGGEASAPDQVLVAQPTEATSGDSDLASQLTALQADPAFALAESEQSVAKAEFSSNATPSAEQLVLPVSEADEILPSDDRKKILSTAPRFDGDPRIVTLLDGNLSPKRHKPQDGLQLFTGQRVWRLIDIPGDQIKHSDGQTWFGWERAPDGRPAYTARLRRGQPAFQGSTLRAEWHAPSGGKGNQKFAIDERGSYWFASDYQFGSDVVSNTGRQYRGSSQITVSGAHAIGWGDFPKSSGQDFGLRTNGNQLYMRIHGPGAAPSYIYDVRKNPLSTTVIGQTNSGGNFGTSRNWIISDIAADQSIKLVGRVKFSNVKSGNPRLQVWRKIGNGPMVKIIDNSDPNTFSTGLRYWKVGLYTWDTSSTWWGDRNTRTLRIRSDLWMRDESSSGRPNLTENALMAWLER